MRVRAHVRRRSQRGESLRVLDDSLVEVTRLELRVALRLQLLAHRRYRVRVVLRAVLSLARPRELRLDHVRERLPQLGAEHAGKFYAHVVLPPPGHD